jgi:hypothetical protein
MRVIPGGEHAGELQPRGLRELKAFAFVNCLRHDNQEHSHREARLSGRMPQIAPLRFAVRQTQCIAPRAHSALAQKKEQLRLAAHWLQFNSCAQIMAKPIYDASASIHS